MTDPDDFAHLLRAEYMFPGPGRDRLVDAILSGAKTATSCLLAELERAGEPPPQVRERELVVDSAGQPVCVTETTGVQVVRLAAVGDEHAHAEGEGYADAAAWRAGHERFWTSAGMMAELGSRPSPSPTRRQWCAPPSGWCTGSEDHLALRVNWFGEVPNCRLGHGTPSVGEQAVADVVDGSGPGGRTC